MATGGERKSSLRSWRRSDEQGRHPGGGLQCAGGRAEPDSGLQRPGVWRRVAASAGGFWQRAAAPGRRATGCGGCGRRRGGAGHAEPDRQLQQSCKNGKTATWAGLSCAVFREKNGKGGRWFDRLLITPVQKHVRSAVIRCQHAKTYFSGKTATWAASSCAVCRILHGSTPYLPPAPKQWPRCPQPQRPDPRYHPWQQER